MLSAYSAEFILSGEFLRIGSVGGGVRRGGGFAYLERRREDHAAGLRLGARLVFHDNADRLLRDLAQRLVDGGKHWCHHGAELDIVHEIHRPSGNVYELVRPGHHHHHLICTECGKTECIDICPMNKIYEKEAEKRGFLVTGHVFEFYGICWSCRSKAKK